MDVTNFIGNTPLVKLKSNEANCADVYVKIEHFNAGGSIKSRVAKAMVENAEKEGVLCKGKTIIEPTGGNTGIGIAMLAALHGYKFIAVVPDNYSRERIELLKHYNAEVELSDSGTGNDSHIVLAKKIMEKNPSLVWLDQLSNEANVATHYNGTAKEILEHIKPDAFVACVGSSGTFTGVSRRLKEAAPQTKCYVAQPTGCDIMNGKAIKHKIQGASIGIVPPLLDYSLIDGIINVGFHDAREILRSLVKTQGLFLGISSGANIYAAFTIAKMLDPGKKVCTVAPDGGQYYVNEVYKADS